MDLLYLNHNVIWRGTFYRCLAYGRELVRLGHAVTIVTIAPRERWRFARELHDGVEVISSPDLSWGLARSGWDPWDTLRRCVYLRGRRFDLVHAFDGRPVVVLPALYLRRRLGCPLVMDWADWWGRGGVISERSSWFLKHLFAPVETWFEEAFRADADALTVISSALAERARGLGIDEQRIHRLPGGVDPELWSPRPRDRARRRLELPGEAPLVLFSGFVHYDIALVLDSFAWLYARRPDSRLVLTGRPQAELADELARRGLAEAVINRGTVPAGDVIDYVAAADVCLMPFADKQANRGRWPNKLGDYLAMGRAVVTNPVADVGRLLVDAQAGLLTAPSGEAMGQALLQLLDDAALRRRLEQAARALAVERLAYSRLVLPLESLYQRLLEPGADART